MATVKAMALKAGKAQLWEKMTMKAQRRDKEMGNAPCRARVQEKGTWPVLV